MARGIPRHNEVIKYLKHFEIKHFRMPTLKEACHDLIIGRGSLARVLKRLVNQQRLRRIPRGVVPYRIMR